MGSVFFDYFRSPESEVQLSTAGSPAHAGGFFTFDKTVCYGRPSGVRPSPAVHGAPDVTNAVVLQDERICLPFDLSEAVDNLRRERYQGPEFGFATSALARRAYYGLRPLLNVGLRKYLQKLRLKQWRGIEFPRWPVDASVDNLLRGVQRQVLASRGGEPVPFIWFWPDSAPGCAMVTHDVEQKSGRDSCESLMDLDEEFGICSAFQVVPEGRYPGSRELIERVRSRGFEANIHDLNHDGNLYRSKKEFLKRAARINNYARAYQCHGFRSGVMYREQEWYEALDFEYDMSVPNVAHLEPQRGGCCTVKPYFVGDMLELPLTTTQDYSLFHILDDYSTSLWRRQIRDILAENGLVSIIAHPDYLIESRARVVYRELLQELVRRRDEEGLWIATPSQINEWWRARHEMTLVREGDSWRIEGALSNRASVAHAVLDNGECVYTLDPLISKATSPGAPEPMKSSACR